MTKLSVDDAPYVLINALDYQNTKDVQDFINQNRPLKTLQKKRRKR